MSKETKASQKKRRAFERMNKVLARVGMPLELVHILADEDEARRAVRALSHMFHIIGGPVVEDLKEYPLVVDFSKSFDQMVADGEYEFIANHVAPFAWTSDGESSVRRTCVLLQFKNEVASESVDLYMRRRGLRPATSRELLAFGAAYPQLEQQNPIVSLERQYVRAYSNLGVLVLDNTDAVTEREIRAGSWGGGFPSRYCFLACKVKT